ncbi:MAG: hypothetical protein ACLGIN_08330 [Candidatus Sericytochromatia bacterium]
MAIDTAPRSRPMPRAAAILWLLSALFLARVVGQILVAFLGVTFLPPMPEWYSGLLPYHLLLPSQVAILALMLWINLGIGRGTGVFGQDHPRFARFLLLFALLYAGAMAVRYVVSGQLHPERRFWPPGSIPIVFHFVLAGYLFLVSRLLRRDAA